MMKTTSMGRMFEGRERRTAVDSENCRDRGECGARIPRLYMNTKTFYKPEGLPMHRRPPVREKKDGECRKREWAIAENECMGG